MSKDSAKGDMQASVREGEIDALKEKFKLLRHIKIIRQTYMSGVFLLRTGRPVYRLAAFNI